LCAWCAEQAAVEKKTNLQETFKKWGAFNNDSFDTDADIVLFGWGVDIVLYGWCDRVVLMTCASFTMDMTAAMTMMASRNRDLIRFVDIMLLYC
jgi:hypothetical protein